MGRDAFGNLAADLPRMFEQFAPVDDQNVVQLLDPVCHIHGHLPPRLTFGECEVLFDKQTEVFHFVFGQVVLGGCGIGFGNAPRVALVAGGHAHHRQPGIGTMSDQLGGRLAADGPQQFVLHDFEKLDRLFSFRVVVDARRVDVLDLLVEHPFRKADFADALLQFVEIVHRLARLHPFVVQCEALDEVFAQHLRRPDAELRALVRFHAVADRNNHVEVVVVRVVAFAVGGSCSEIPNN